MPLLLLLLTFSAFADFQKLSLGQLDFEYTRPGGQGTVEKIKLGYDIFNDRYPVEVSRTDHSFEVTTPFIDVSWEKPWEFVFDLEKLSTKGTSLNLGEDKHWVRSDLLSFKPANRGEYLAQGVDGTCAGTGQGDFQTKLMDDCLNSLDLSIKRVEIPSDIILYKILAALPPVQDALNVPADDLLLHVEQGNFSLVFAIKYYVYAHLRAWGHVQYEDDHQTVAVRIDEIKFGYLPVTSLVMKKMQEMVKSPRVKVDPPWVRVDIGQHEN